MWHSELNFGEFTNKLISLRDYYYMVDTYSISHRQLSIILSSMKTDEKLYMLFDGVDYIQLPTYWRGFALKPGLPQKCQEILTNAKLADQDNKHLFSIEEGNFVVHIICSGGMITNERPEYFNTVKITNERPEMWHSELNFGEFTDKLISLRDYFYQVGTYIVSRQQLFITLESMKVDYMSRRLDALYGISTLESVKTDEKLYMLFDGVDYIQLPTYWRGFALKPGLPQKCQEILTGAGLAHEVSNSHLFSIEEGDFVVHIICSTVMITNEPPHPYEYLK